MSKKYKGYRSLVITTENIVIMEKVSYEDVPIQIHYHEVCKLRTNEVASSMVLWRNQFAEKATWEAKEDKKKIHPHSFPSVGDQSNDFLKNTL